MGESLRNIVWDLVYKEEAIFLGFSRRNQKQEKPCVIGESKLVSFYKIFSLDN